MRWRIGICCIMLALYGCDAGTADYAYSIVLNNKPFLFLQGCEYRRGDAGLFVLHCKSATFADGTEGKP